MEQRYKVIFEGAIQPDFDLDEVKSNLTALYGDNRATVAKLFAAPKVLIKADLDLATAEQYRAAFEKTGALCRIVAMEEPSPAVPSAAGPAEEARTAPPEESSGPRPEQAAPAWQTEAGAPQTADSTAGPPLAEPAVGPAGRAPVRDYDFSIRQVIEEAWDRTAGVKGTIWAALAIFGLINLALNLVVGMPLALLGLGENSVVSLAAQFTMSIALQPLLAGIVMIGVERAADRPVNYRMIFGYFGYMVPIVVAAFLILILTYLGFILLVLPGIYLTIAYMLALPLIIDRRMEPWQAMETSRRAISRHWFKVFFLYTIMGIVIFISMLPMFVGLIWTIPMTFIVGGILYRIIFGRES